MHAMKMASANFGKFTAVETLFNQLFGQLKSMRTILAIIFMTFGTQASAADFAFSTTTLQKGPFGLARDITVANLELNGPIQKGDYKKYLEIYEWVSKNHAGPFVFWFQMGSKIKHLSCNAGAPARGLCLFA